MDANQTVDQIMATLTDDEAKVIGIANVYMIAKGVNIEESLRMVKDSKAATTTLNKSRSEVGKVVDGIIAIINCVKVDPNYLNIRH